jgi:hypothetical protein
LLLLRLKSDVRGVKLREKLPLVELSRSLKKRVNQKYLPLN